MIINKYKIVFGNPEGRHLQVEDLYTKRRLISKGSLLAYEALGWIQLTQYRLFYAQ
jgi:hypothetical protein